MRCIYSGDPERFGRIMGAVYYMVDTDITRRYRIYSIPKQGLELRFKDEEHAMWFKLAKGRFVK